MKAPMRLLPPALGLLLASLATAAQPPRENDQRVVRVILGEERLQSFAQHTEDHLGLFDTRDPAFPLDEFVSPGAKRDPLPAIAAPVREPAADTNFPPDDGLVVEVVVEGEAVAYPLAILTYHGVVNDVIAGAPVAVWFDPISYGLAVFRRDPVPVRGDVVEPLEFRLAGLLVRGGAALYDRQTQSLFSPLDGVGVTGSYSGVALDYLPFRVTSMKDFKAVRPGGEVVTKPHGAPFNYDVNPFAGYQGDPDTIYVKTTDDLRLPPKTPGVGIALDDAVYFIPFAAMIEDSRRVMTSNGAFEATLTPDKTLYIREAPPGATYTQAYFANWASANPTSKILMPVDVRETPAPQN